MDVIAKCAFGLNIDKLGEKDDPFMANAKTVFNNPVIRSPLVIIPCKFIGSKSHARLLICTSIYSYPSKDEQLAQRPYIRHQAVHVFHKSFGERHQGTSFIG